MDSADPTDAVAVHDDTLVVLADQPLEPKGAAALTTTAERFAAANTRSDAPAAVVDAVLDAYGLAEATAPTPTTRPGGVERAEQVAGEYRPVMFGRQGPG